MIRPSRISFGGTAAIVTSMALIAGLEAANAGRPGVISALLIAAVADNLTDSLSIHMYQESERFERKDAFIGTLSNFGTRFVVCVSFVLIVVMLPKRLVAVAGIAWGMSLLAILTFILARHRQVSTFSEVVKHLGVAISVIAVSRMVGEWIAAHVI
jgi:VIT1/CCC1 family predicted Fe2+/Mn2+ transporter